MVRLVPILFCVLFIAFVRGEDQEDAENVAVTKNQQIRKKIRKALHVADPANILNRLNETREFNPRFEVAATFGNLTFESLMLMDKYLQMMVSGVMKAIKNMNISSWEELLDYFDKIPYLKMFNSTRDGFHEGRIEFRRKDNAKLLPTVDYIMVNNIENWFYRLIQDPTVIHETKIDIRQLALIAATQVFRYRLKNLIYEKDFQSAAIMDMAILRFPDVSYPYLQVFVIKLYITRLNVRLLWKRIGSSSVTGKFNVIKYHPNKKYLAQLRQQIQDALMADIEDMFS